VALLPFPPLPTCLVVWVLANAYEVYPIVIQAVVAFCKQAAWRLDVMSYRLLLDLVSQRTHATGRNLFVS
jgi:hypothetical protein